MQIHARLFLLTLPLLAILLAGCAEKIDTLAEWVEVARKHERDEQFARAIVAYESALKLAPQSAMTWYDLGVSYEQLSQFEQADDSYSQAIRLQADLSDAYNNRAVVRVRMGQFKEAISDCDQAIRLNPSDAFAWRNRGLAQLDLGNIDLAIADFDQVLRIDRRSQDSYLYRGNAFLEKEDSVRALQDFEHALQLDPEFETAMIGKAKALSRLDKGNKAREWLAKAASSGADVGDVELVAIAAAPAPLPSEPIHPEPTDVAAEYLRNQGLDSLKTDAPAGCDFYDAETKTGYVVRRMNSTGQIIFEDRDIALLEQVPDSLSLVILSNGDESKVTQVMKDWHPKRQSMTPASWAIVVDGQQDSEIKDSDIRGES